MAEPPHLVPPIGVFIGATARPWLMWLTERTRQLGLHPLARVACKEQRQHGCGPDAKQTKHTDHPFCIGLDLPKPPFCAGHGATLQQRLDLEDLIKTELRKDAHVLSSSDIKNPKTGEMILYEGEPACFYHLPKDQRNKRHMMPVFEAITGSFLFGHWYPNNNNAAET